MRFFLAEALHGQYHIYLDSEASRQCKFQRMLAQITIRANPAYTHDDNDRVPKKADVVAAGVLLRQLIKIPVEAVSIAFGGLSESADSIIAQEPLAKMVLEQEKLSKEMHGAAEELKKINRANAGKLEAMQLKTAALDLEVRRQTARRAHLAADLAVCAEENLKLNAALAAEVKVSRTLTAGIAEKRALVRSQKECAQSLAETSKSLADAVGQLDTAITAAIAAREARQAQLEAEIQGTRALIDAATARMRAELEAERGELEATRSKMEGEKAELEAVMAQVIAATAQELETKRVELEAKRGELEGQKAQLERQTVDAELETELARRRLAEVLEDLLHVRGTAKAQEALMFRAVVVCPGCRA